MYFAGYLHPGEDDDLIAWWNSLPKGKRFPILIATLRSGGMAAGVAEDDAAVAEDAADEILRNFVS